MIDVFLIPQRFEDGIGKAHDQNILHGFFAEVVINAKNLALIEELCQSVINRARAGQIMAQRLFHNDARAWSLSRPGDQSGGVELLHTGDNQLWRDSQIKDAIAGNAEFVLDLVEPLPKGGKDGGILEGARHIEEGACKVRPAREIELAA